MKLFLIVILFAGTVLNAQTLTHKPLVIAHRGASGDAPENTIASIDKALAAGADVIEIDVHQTLDSAIIVMHDEKLDRTTNKSGLIKNYTWAEIKDADAGSWFSSDYTGERIPTLDEVILRINGKARLLIEIKKGGTYYPGIERRVFDIVKKQHAESWSMMQSFSDAAVNNWLALDSEIAVYQLVVNNIPPLQQRIAGVNPYRSFAKKRTIRKLHQRGQQVFVWTVNDEKHIRKLTARGVDGIITNFPAKLKHLLTE